MVFPLAAESYLHGVLDEIEANQFSGTVEFDGDYINTPRSILVDLVFGDKSVGEFDELQLLARGDGFFGSAVTGAATGFDFDECQTVRIFSDDINLSGAGADVAREDTIAMLFEMQGGDAFCRIAKILAGASGRGHARNCSTE